MSKEKRKTLMTVFREPQFNCLSIWIFYSKTSFHSISRFQERALRTVYFDCKSSFNGLLDKDGSFTSYQKNFERVPNKIHTIVYL